jgi:hypothetical protein
MSGPHPGRQTLSANVTKREHNAVALFLNGEKISRQVANGEDLARDFKFSEANVTRSAQAAMHLGRFKNFGPQFSIVLLKIGKFNFEFLVSSLG